MNINVCWNDSEKTAIRYDLCGSWAWGDFETANLRAYEMIVAVNHRVSIVLNLENSLELPSQALMPFRRMLAYAPDNLDLVIVSGADENEERIIRLLTQFDSMLSTRITLSHSLETAQRLVIDFHRVSDAYTSRSYPA